MLRLSRWALVLIGSAAVLFAAAVILGVLWLSSVRTTASAARMPASVQGLELRVDQGDVTIVGGSHDGVSISHSDRSTFGRGPRERRSVTGGVVRISSTCPRLVLGSCGASYRVDLPNDVPISIRTERGDIRLDSYHGSADIATDSGEINVEGFCGFVLGAASASGNVDISSTCSPERLTLRSETGDVSATVPPGNYRIQAASNSGPATVRGLTDDGGAPWAIQALSSTGRVRVSAGS